MGRGTSAGAGLCLVRPDVESEELSILEIFLVFGMQVGAEQLKRAVVEIGATLNFI